VKKQNFKPFLKEKKVEIKVQSKVMLIRGELGGLYLKIGEFTTF